MDIAADFDDAVLGLALPQPAEAALREAGSLRAEPARAMAALMCAGRLAPDHPAVLIAFYRHHFYGHRLHAARDIARRALAVGAAALALPAVWRQVPARALPGVRQRALAAAARDDDDEPVAYVPAFGAAAWARPALA